MVAAYEIRRVISFIFPLYTSMFIGYGSVKWWKLFNQEHCLGISRFCSWFATPVLSFYYLSKTNLYEMKFKLLGADVLQKVIVIAVLECWCKLDFGGSIELLITIFSICTLPNALILGLPIMKSMYHATPLVVQIFLTQSMIWHPLLLIMYEHREARIVISQQFGDTHGRHVDIETTTTNEQGEELDIHMHLKGHESSHNQPFTGNEQEEIKKVPSTSTTDVIPEATEHQRTSSRPTSMPSTSMITKQVVKTVLKKFIKNPNTCATILGLVCAFLSSQFHIPMPSTITRSVAFLSNASLGMGMFNMGLSIGLQPALIPCGKVVAALTMVLRFIIGPIVMIFASLVIGLRGTILHVAVVQAALSQGVVPSIFAVHYNVYPEVFSTGMTFGVVFVVPVTLLYYNLFKIQE